MWWIIGIAAYFVLIFAWTWWEMKHAVPYPDDYDEENEFYNVPSADRESEKREKKVE